jgi:hypothetical protein
LKTSASPVLPAATAVRHSSSIRPSPFRTDGNGTARGGGTRLLP